MAGLLVVFTDLAFGWSTTLDIEAEEVQTLVGVIAFPWHRFLAVAVPDGSLVETSRYFRLEAPTISAERASRLGGWWPFVVMTIVVWGLLPRSLVAGIAAWQLRRQTRRLLEEGPQIAALLDRLTAPRVDFEGSAASSGIPAPGSEPRSVRDRRWICPARLWSGMRRSVTTRWVVYSPVMVLGTPPASP
ncbi:MAG: DUF2868 domain-containing protein [Gammaproteobacteria bacterium]|nr:DUF2868 domain-containing protein [Gammaproteobacteria bacterium]